MKILRRLNFWWRYIRGHTPWDTNQTPPEIVQLVEQEQLSPGRALDLGCGTGTNAIYLARHGWQAAGIDFVGRAIRTARRKARKAGVTARTRFLVGDVTKLNEMNLTGPFDLIMDIGCGHSLLPADLSQYVADLARLTEPGSVLMLYMFRPTPERPRGFEPDDVEKAYSPQFRLVWSDLGEDQAARTRSVWYRFERSSNS